MSTVEQANKINADINVWFDRSPEDRALAVLEWAFSNGIDSGSVTVKPLVAAMRRQKYWAQGPDDYLDMLQSIVAYLAIR